MPSVRPTGCASQLPGPGREVTDCTPSAPSASCYGPRNRYAMRDIALLRAARSPLRGTWAPMRLALTRPASASRLAEHAVGPSGAALPARCAAQSCEKQGALLSWSIVQRGCESSTAPVLWCESLMGGNLLLHRHAQCLLSGPVPRHAGWRMAPASQRCPRRRAACRSTSAAMNGARGASCRAWSGRPEARGCRSTPRRMRAVEAARQATCMVRTRSPLLLPTLPINLRRLLNRKFGWGVRRSRVATSRSLTFLSFPFAGRD